MKLRLNTHLYRFIEALLLATGSGCGAVILQAKDSPWDRELLAFFGAFLPVMAVQLRQEQSRIAERKANAQAASDEASSAGG